MCRHHPYSRTCINTRLTCQVSRLLGHDGPLIASHACLLQHCFALLIGFQVGGGFRLDFRLGGFKFQAGGQHCFALLISGCPVMRLGFGVWGVGCGVQDWGFRARGLVFEVWGLGLRDGGTRPRIASDLKTRVREPQTPTPTSQTPNANPLTQNQKGTS